MEEIYITVNEAVEKMKDLGCKEITSEKMMKLCKKYNFGRSVYFSYLVDRKLFYQYLDGIAL